MDIDEVKEEEEERGEQKNPAVAVHQKRQMNTTMITSTIHPKRMRVTTDEAHPPVTNLDKDTESIPIYLSLTNKTFSHFVRNLLGGINSISIQDLQYIAFCIHRHNALHIQKQVTSVYLKSGTGTLRDPGPELKPVDRRVWPTQVKAEMATRRQTNTTESDMHVEDEQQAYEHLVQERFQEITQQMDHYQQQLTQKKKQLVDFTLNMENMIRDYVHQKGIYPLKVQRDLKISLLQSDYDAEIMERQFLQENPTEYHVIFHFYEIYCTLAFLFLLFLFRYKQLNGCTKHATNWKRPNEIFRN